MARNKIVIVGEAWGREEEQEQTAWVGMAGKLLKGLLSSVGINYYDCYATNVFNLRPQPSNDVSNLCGPKDGGIPHMKSLASGKYVRAEYEPELQRPYKEIHNEAPNLIIACGGTALWALTGQSKIKKNRGTIIESHLRRKSNNGDRDIDETGNGTKQLEGYKVMPTYHTAAMMRQWSLRPIIISDLEKASREACFPEIRRPQREIWIEPTDDDIFKFWQLYIEPSPNLSIDIETIQDQITCIGFAPRKDIALVIPFYDREQEDGNYWRSHSDEVIAWEWVRFFCGMKKKIVGQNILYDINFLWRTMGITVPHVDDDTMLLHHALQPEMEKSLAFLGSIYTNESSWKLRHSETLKRED